MEQCRPAQAWRKKQNNKRVFGPGTSVERNDGCSWRREFAFPVGWLKSWMWQC